VITRSAHAPRTALAALTLAACADAPVDDAARYLHDPSFRRAAMERSLTTRDNHYARLRLARYPAEWDALPAWNPRAEPLSPARLAPDALLSPEARPLDVSPAASAGDRAALVALGAIAFARYPAQLLPAAARSLTSLDRARAYGLWVDPARGVGGLVRAAMADGSPALAMSCSTCHAASANGALALGLGNASLDLGRLAADDGTSPASRAWGPGRVDVTTDDGSAPVRIPDLRPTRYLTHLQYNATVVQRDVIALAVRLETLLITAHHEVVRPPREVALGLALYLWTLAPADPLPPRAGTVEATGRALFDTRCASCHAPPGFAGQPVALAVVGTDAFIGRSPYRGTGMYRVPSLLGVSARGSLLHDGTAPDLDALLDPARLAPDYARRLHGAGAIPGHTFGLDLTAPERAALAAYLRTL
jgi:mono/diheme cytochrome c family protein